MTKPFPTQQTTPTNRIPLSHFRFNKNLSDLDGLEKAMVAKKVFMIKCQPKIQPIDINIEWLTSPNECHSAWNGDLDRIRYSADQIYIRKFEPTKDLCVVAQITSSMSVTIYGNDEKITRQFFDNILFKNSFIKPNKQDLNVLTQTWTSNPHDISYFSGTVHSAFSVWGSTLIERQLSGNC